MAKLLGRKRGLCLLAACLLALASAGALATGTNAAYIDENGQPQSAGAKPLTAGTTTLEAGWYYVTGTVRINQSLLVSGDVKIILADGAHLEVITDAPGAAGIQVETGNSLTVYAQSSGGKAGKLTAQSTCEDFSTAGGGAGIGARGNTGTDANATGDAKATDTRDAGTINLFGGNITATAVRGAGIGGGGGGGYSEGVSGSQGISGSYAFGGSGGTITIAGAVVTAQSQLGAGIGSGAGNTVRDAGTITILSGDVTASSQLGAGIGGGGGIEGWMKMGLKDDASVEAYIVRGDGGDGGTILIEGGHVSASSVRGADIGGGGGADGSVGKEGTSVVPHYGVSAGINVEDALFVSGTHAKGAIGSSGGNGGSGGTITITGGEIDAATIGGGNGGNGGKGGAGGVSLTEAVAGASGGNGGKGGDNGTITLTEGILGADVRTGGGKGGLGGESGKPGLWVHFAHEYADVCSSYGQIPKDANGSKAPLYSTKITLQQKSDGRELSEPRFAAVPTRSGIAVTWLHQYDPA